MCKIKKKLYYKRVSAYTAHTSVARFIIQEDCGRARTPARSETRNRCIRKQARAWMWRACVDARDRALIDFFFTLPGTRPSHKRIPPKTATSGPSEHPEAERRGGEAADCARSTSFDLNIMRCIRTAKQYTRASVTSTDLHTPRIRCRYAGNRKPAVIFQCQKSFRKYNRSWIVNEIQYRRSGI